MIGSLALAICLAVSPPAARPGAPQMDSLLAAAQRAARAWRRHDFAALVGEGVPVAVSLPDARATAPLRPSQAAELLRVFAEGATELDVEVTLARAVDRDRGYVEIQRGFAPRGSQAPAHQTIYLSLRRDGAGFRVAEVRVVP